MSSPGSQRRGSSRGSCSPASSAVCSWAAFAVSAASPLGRDLGEEVLLREVGQPAHPDPQQPHAARGVHGLQQPCGGLPYDRGVVGGAAERLGAGQRREVVAPDLDHDRTSGAPGGPQPLHTAVREAHHLRPHPGTVGQIHLEGVLDRDRLRVPLRHHRPVVPAQRHRVQPGAMGLPQQAHQLRLTGLRGLRDRRDPGPAQRLGSGGPDPGKGPHRHRPQQLPLGARLDHHEPVRFRRLGRDLRQHLGPREPHRTRQTGGLPDIAPQPLPHRADGGRLRRDTAGLQVDERLIQAQRLHQGRQRVQQLHHRLTHLAVEGEARIEIRGVGAQAPRLSGGHRRTDAEDPGLVRRRGDHPARPDPADHHGLPAQTRLGRLFGGREEGIHVQMQDRRRRSHTIDAPAHH